MLRKIKDLRKKGNRNPRTEEQKKRQQLIGTLTFLTKNPMKRPECVAKMLETKRERYGNHFFGIPFGMKNPYTFGFKGKKHTEETKKIISMKRKGRKNTERQKEIARKLFLQNNPMKRPECVAKKREQSRIQFLQNNPMKRPECVAKMLETKRRKKELQQKMQISEEKNEKEVKSNEV